VFHNSYRVVVRQSLKSHRHHSSICRCSIEVAVIVIFTPTAHIRIVIFCDHSKQGGVGVGEDGYIRLRRQETPQCAIDSSPLDGSGCVDGGVESVVVCGTCAVVSDNSYPLGTTFMS
jgi:hypothetical protein